MVSVSGFGVRDCIFFLGGWAGGLGFPGLWFRYIFSVLVLVLVFLVLVF